MAITKYILTNSNDVITIASVDLKIGNLPYDTNQLPDGLNRDWCYDPGVSNAASAMNLGQLWDECNGKPLISGSAFNTFLNWRTAEDMASDVFISLKNSVENAMSYLWGNMNDGGYGFIHTDGGIMTFWHCGIAKRVNGGVDQYSYAISLGGVSHGGNIPKTYVIDCVLTCVNNGGGRFPDMVLWCSNKTYSGSNKYFKLFSNPIGSPAFYWDDIDEDLASVYTAQPNYSSALLVDPFPTRPWYIDNAYSRTYCYYDYADLYIIGGWAGREVESEEDPFGDTTGDDDMGGDGDWNGSGEEMPAADMDDISDDAINSGFVTLYKATKSQIRSFNDWIWTDITDNLSQQIKRVISSPMEAILFVALTHLAPPTSESTSEIKFCGISTGISALTIPKQHKTYDCGYLNFKNTYGDPLDYVKGDTDTFLDYQPYSKAEIYIPGIGFKELDVNDIIGSRLHLKLNVDWVSGSMLASLEVSRDKRKDGDGTLINDVLYEFQGNIYTILPLAASDWKSFYSNVISGIGGLGSMLSGNVAGIASGAAQTASNVMSQQVSIQKSGTVSSAYSFMAQENIGIYITRPNPAIPIDIPNYGGFKSFKGYVRNQTYNLSQLSGYTEIEEDTLWINSDFGDITEEEAQMLRDICGSGFYL